ncbi:MAG: pyruvate:ferredoxin (flavodoxin) oxidoreductase [Firmicutes bacterium]|nr:pyruvate:ferredoxin (flavodoxin) oxidoreductase [Bacillota bacterium]
MENYIVSTANEIVAKISYNFLDIACVYPITPSTEISEIVDRLSFVGKKNLFGQKVLVKEMQSEAGCAGMLHGSLTSGALAATFTCSQGLLLMIPEMYRIASSFLPAVIHVASRSVARHALSIFGDHSDVYACRQTGFAMICSSNVQESCDFAVISHLSAIESSYAFLHFFDGFRTSHEIKKIRDYSFDELSKLMNWDSLKNFRNSSLNPCRNFIRGSNQNDDIFFQCCEAGNFMQEKVSKTISKYMSKINKKFGEDYDFFNFFGHIKAEHIIIAMGSVCETIEEVVDYLTKNNKKVGLIKVRIFRPFLSKFLKKSIPEQVKKISVLDKSKEVGSVGEPLFLDVLGALNELNLKHVEVLNGRYGIAGKNTTPSDILSVFENMESSSPKFKFTIGINDNLTNFSLKNSKNIELSNAISCKFFGCGSDGMISAVKNISIIIGENTDLYIQCYPQYDSRKSGGLTISHLRFSEHEIKSEYYIEKADYVVCSNFSYIFNCNFFENFKKKSCFLLNFPYEKDQISNMIPYKFQEFIKKNQIKFYIINAKKIIKKSNLGNRLSAVMQSAFLKICSDLPFENSENLVKSYVENSYAYKDENLKKSNSLSVELSFKNVVRVENSYFASEANKNSMVETIENSDCNYNLSVKDFKNFANGNVLCGSSKLRKNFLKTEKIPSWLPENCSQCGICSLICPHAVIRLYAVVEHEMLTSMKFRKMFGYNHLNFVIGISSDQCTGCSNCEKACPGIKGKKALVMDIKDENQQKLFDYLEILPKKDEISFSETNIKNSQFKKPLMEFSGACPGCGETAYIKLVTQLFGERLLISNATGCSSIFGGAVGAVPYVKNVNGLGPSWQNSLFENAAEFGLGMSEAQESIRSRLLNLIHELMTISDNKILKKSCLKYIETFDLGKENFKASSNLIKLLESDDQNLIQTKEILSEKEYLSKKSVWIFGGDGWGYDIGFGGLDHVLSSGKDINILLLDTEIYSNTGGQASKSTPKHAAVPFALGGKEKKKKELAKMMMTYGDIYISHIAVGANPNQCIKAFIEAENYIGPSIIIAYSPCIGHGIDGGMENSIDSQKIAVKAGHFNLFRFDPRLKEKMILDSKPDNKFTKDFFKSQSRFKKFFSQSNRNMSKIE